MATYDNEHATVITKDDGTRYQITTFRDVSGGVEALCMGSATSRELLTAIKRLSEIIVRNAVEEAIKEFGDRGMLVAVLGAYGVKQRMVREVLDSVARGCGLDPKDVEVKSWTNK